MSSSTPRFGVRAVWLGLASRGWFAWLVLVLICVLAIALRCLHLFKADHYYVLSADSYYFHRMADLVACGERYFYPTQGVFLPYWLHSGLTYPVGLLTRMMAFVTGAVPHDAMDLVAKFVPPAIATVTIVVLWLVVSRMYGRFVAHLTAFCWAVALLPVFFGAAGYLDRDGISLLLVIMGVSVFYLMRDVHLKKGRLDFGWVIRGASVLLFEGLLYLEWGFLGPLILLTILATYVIAEIMSNIWPWLVSAFYSEKDPFVLPVTVTKEGIRRLVPAVSQSSYRAAMLALAVSVIAAVFRPSLLATIYRTALPMFNRGSSGAQSVAELQGIGFGDILSMQLLVVPLLVGLYVTIRKRRGPDILWVSWFLVLFVGGLFARRLFSFAVPALCVLCGVGLAAMLDLKGAKRFSLTELGAGLVEQRTVLKYMKAITGVVLILAILTISVSMSYQLGSRSRLVAVTPEWQETLTWLRENTPEDSRIMTWWDYGYWILAVGHRAPVVDNGVHWPSYDRDIARVYCATNDAEAVEIMQKYGARYLVFSDEEIVTLPGISEAALGTSYGDGTSIPYELKGSLFDRSLDGQIEFDGGLKRVYPALEVEEPAVVVLEIG